jgi:hypothetical protein
VDCAPIDGLPFGECREKGVTRGAFHRIIEEAEQRP